MNGLHVLAAASIRRFPVRRAFGCVHGRIRFRAGQTGSASTSVAIILSESSFSATVFRHAAGRDFSRESH